MRMTASHPFPIKSRGKLFQPPDNAECCEHIAMGSAFFFVSVGASGGTWSMLDGMEWQQWKRRRKKSWHVKNVRISPETSDESFFFFLFYLLWLCLALSSRCCTMCVCAIQLSLRQYFFFCSFKLHVERLSPYQLRLLINAFLRWHEFKRSNERARMYRCSPPKRSGTSSTCNRAERLCSIIRRVNTELCWRRAHLPDMLCAERTFRTCICSSSAIDSDPKWQSSRCMSETTPTYVSPVIPIVDFPQINIQLRSGMHHLMWRYTVHSYNATSNVFNN